MAPDGALRVVDYKTGGAPREAFEARALFQLKFYALVLWRTRGVVPRVLRLVYLKDARGPATTPRTPTNWCGSNARWWRSGARSSRPSPGRISVPQPSRLCDWCNHQAHCPTFGGTPPPFPEQHPADPVAADPAVPGADE